MVLYTGDRSRTIRLGERVSLRLGNLPERDQCNTGIVRTGDGLVLIDYPAQCPDEEILDEAEGYFGASVTHIVFTHAHGDHRAGLATLHRRGVGLVARGSALREIADCHPHLDLPVREVRDGERLCLGGVSFGFWLPRELPAHSPWDMAVLLPEDGIAFTGDFLVPPRYLYAHSCGIGNWRRELERFGGAVTEPLLAMGHGEPQPRETALETMRAYLRELDGLSGGLRRLAQMTDPQTVLRQLRELAR